MSPRFVVACSRNKFSLEPETHNEPTGHTKFDCTGYQNIVSIQSSQRTFQASVEFLKFLKFHSKFLMYNGKYVKNSTHFSAFLNKQFANIVFTKRLELHLCERRELCFENTVYQKFIKNHAFIYTAAKSSDKNSLNPLRASVSSVDLYCCC